MFELTQLIFYFTGNRGSLSSIRKRITLVGSNIRYRSDFLTLTASLQHKASEAIKKNNVCLKDFQSLCSSSENDIYCREVMSDQPASDMNSNPQYLSLQRSVSFPEIKKSETSIISNITSLKTPESEKLKILTSSTDKLIKDEEDQRKVAPDSKSTMKLVTRKPSVEDKKPPENLTNNIKLAHTIISEFSKNRAQSTSTSESPVIGNEKGQSEDLSISDVLKPKSFPIESNDSYEDLVSIRKSIQQSREGLRLFNFDAQNFHPACPLPFCSKELEILNLDDRDGVNNDIRAGIIWNAIEREQVRKYNSSQTSENETSSILPKMPKPASSRSILELLMLPKCPNSLPTTNSPHDDQEEQEDDESNMHFLDDDAVLVHTIDAVLSHYANDSHKVNPFETWSGAGDKGAIGKEIPFANNGSKNANAEHNIWWKSYYSKEIMGSMNDSSTKSSHGTSGKDWKMKRGHKLTSCLLSWAKNMQINRRVDFNAVKNLKLLPIPDFNWIERPRPDVEFVAEIMRLLAARWMESSSNATKTTRSSKNKQEGIRTKRKRGRPPLSSNSSPIYTKNRLNQNSESCPNNGVNAKKLKKRKKCKT